MKLTFKNLKWVENIQVAAYNGERMVYRSKRDKLILLEFSGSLNTFDIFIFIFSRQDLPILIR